MDALENLKQVSEKYYEWKGKTREAAVDYLNSVLTEENPFVTFVDDFEFDYYYECVGVFYDGSGNPGDEPNVYSRLYSVYREGDGFFLDLEDACGYSINKLSVDDLLAVCECLQDHLDNLKEDEL